MNYFVSCPIIVYKDLIISTIVDVHGITILLQVYKELIISTIVDFVDFFLDVCMSIRT